MDQEEDDFEPVPFQISEIQCNRTGDGPVRLIFTHGAGGAITSDGIANFSTGFARRTASSIVCFQGNMNLKSRVKMFDTVHDSAIRTFEHETPLALGGRSMGARAAVLAAIQDTKFFVLASYPLQTDKKVRDQILLDLPDDKEVLFISGDHDSMCDLAKLNEVRKKMKAKTWLIRVRDADHGMNIKPKKATRAVGEATGILAEEWLHTRTESKNEREIWWEADDRGEGHVRSGCWARAGVSKTKDEVRETPSEPKQNGSSEAGSKSRKEAKGIPARTKKANSGGTKDSNDKQRDEDIKPATELRRSKRRKIG